MSHALDKAMIIVGDIADKLQAKDHTLNRMDAIKEAFQIAKKVAEEKKVNGADKLG